MCTTEGTHTKYTYTREPYEIENEFYLSTEIMLMMLILVLIT